jgi:hypothetical protein
LLFRFGGEFRPSLSRDQNLTYQGVNGYAFSLRFFKLGSLHIRRKIERQRHGNPSLYRNLPILRRFTNFVTGNLAGVAGASRLRIAWLDPRSPPPRPVRRAGPSPSAAGRVANLPGI